MIMGVGVDMVEITRIRKALENSKTGHRFRTRVYTENEIRYCEKKGRTKYQSYAGRFAAKEAVMKALGKGWGSRIGWTDIEVLPAPGGKPEIHLHDKSSTFAHERGIRRLALSITHTADYALAYVITQNE